MKVSPEDPLAWIDDALAALEERELRRRLSTHDGPQQAVISTGAGELINFGSNDYLGLAADPRLIAAIGRVAADEGCGAGASPLVTGHSQAHRRLELALAEFEGTEAALVFSSGYAANLGTIAALVDSEDVIYADQHNHASMIDGCRLSRAEVQVYPHGDWRVLKAMLAHGKRFRRRLIVTESVFSMHGDCAPLGELADLADESGSMLLVDEAHATGVRGSLGRGLCEEMQLDDRVHVRVGTLSKALGASGGFVVGSQKLIDWLVNRARSYIFSTALPPAMCAAGLAALEIVRSEPRRRAGLMDRCSDLRNHLHQRGWNLGSSASQILPLIVGQPERAMQLSQRLRAAGILVPAMRPPSVPSGQSLLRISVSAAHTAEMLERLVAALDHCEADFRGLK